MIRCMIAAVCFSLASFSSLSWGYDGEFLNSFAVGGREQVGFSPNLNVSVQNGFGFAAPAIQSDGKILINAPVYNGTSYDFGVLRLNPSGTLDTNFGTAPGGQAIVPFDNGGNDNDVPSAIAIDSAGRIVVAGTVDGDPTTSGTDCGVVRLTSSGTLDTSFSGDGKATIGFDLGPAGQQDDTCYRMRLQSDGKILVVGRAQIGQTPAPNSAQIFRMSMARLTTNGARDTSFNGNGLLTLDFGANYTSSVGLSIIEQADGGILLVGAAVDSSGAPSFAIARVTSSGNLDSSFGNDGTLVFNSGINGYAGGELTDIQLLPDGSFVVLGIVFPSGTSSNVDYFFAKFSSTGSFDSSFGTNGVVVVPFDLGGSLEDIAVALIVDDQGRFIANGAVQTSPTSFLAGVVRLTANGQVDPSFGNQGILSLSTAPENGTQYAEQGLGIALTAQGSLLLTSIATTDSSGDSKVGIAELVNDTIFSGNFELN